MESSPLISPLYVGHRYWHDDLWEVSADAKVGIRAQPDYMRPDDIQVIYQNHWLCPAFALDSDLRDAELQIEQQCPQVQQAAPTQTAAQQEEQQKVPAHMQASTQRSPTLTRTSATSKGKPTGFPVTPNNTEASKDGLGPCVGGEALARRAKGV